MMTKVSALLFSLTALNAANVLAAPSHFGRDVEGSINSAVFGSSSVVPSGSSSAMGAQRTGHQLDHPRLWDDRYCHMPSHNGTVPHHNWHPHNSSAGPSGTASIPDGPNTTPVPPPPPFTAPIGPLTPGVPSSSASFAPSSAVSADPSASTGGADSDPDSDTTGSFDGNDFDLSSGSDLDATHNSSTSSSSSSNDNDTLQIDS